MEPVSSSSYYTIRHFALDTTDTIKRLFFRILGVVNDKWKPYAEYYDKKITRRQITLDSYSDNIIRTSANILYPSKQVPIPALISPKPNKYIIKELKKKIDVNLGICHGMCIDYMRRFIACKKPFDETINEVAKKFEKGSTKKGYFYQFQLKTIKLAPEYLDTKCKKYLDKDYQKFSNNEIATKLGEKLNLNIKLNNPELETEEELLKKIDELAKDDDYIEKIYILSIRLQARLSIERKHKDKSYECLNVGFIHEPAKCKPLSLSRFENLEDGDYMIRERGEHHHGHMICFFKRNDRYVIFDPNYGTLSFDSPQNVYEFINRTTKSMFKEEEVTIAIIKCVKKPVINI